MPSSLRDWIVQQKGKEIPLSLTLQILRDIANGMKYLHERNIIHRDLKSPNILINQNFDVKITDFGLAKSVSQIAETLNTDRGIIGTIPWTAPEYIDENRKGERNEKGDVFSFGVIIWELIKLEFPWQQVPPLNPGDIAWSVAHGARLKIPSPCPKELENMMLRCWNSDPKERPSFTTLHHELNIINENNYNNNNNNNNNDDWRMVAAPTDKEEVKIVLEILKDVDSNSTKTIPRPILQELIKEHLSLGNNRSAVVTFFKQTGNVIEFKATLTHHEQKNNGWNAVGGTEEISVRLDLDNLKETNIYQTVHPKLLGLIPFPWDVQIPQNALEREIRNV